MIFLFYRREVADLARWAAGSRLTYGDSLDRLRDAGAARDALATLAGLSVEEERDHLDAAAGLSTYYAECLRRREGRRP